MSRELERRFRTGPSTAEIRAAPSGGAVIGGYCAVFNSPSEDMGFVETIDPNAFSKTLQEADVRALGNHQPDWLLGRTKPGTLKLTTDATGLAYSISINQADPDGVRAIEKVRRGDWDGSSFTFQTISDQWDWSASPPERRLLEVALIDVGPCTWPAYQAATAQARSILQTASQRRAPRLALAEAELDLMRLRVPQTASRGDDGSLKARRRGIGAARRQDVERREQDADQRGDAIAARSARQCGRQRRRRERGPGRPAGTGRLMLPLRDSDREA